MLVIVFVPLMVCLNTATPAVTDTIPIGRHTGGYHVLTYLSVLQCCFRAVARQHSAAEMLLLQCVSLSAVRLSVCRYISHES